MEVYQLLHFLLTTRDGSSNLQQKLDGTCLLLHHLKWNPIFFGGEREVTGSETSKDKRLMHESTYNDGVLSRLSSLSENPFILASLFPSDNSSFPKQANLIVASSAVPISHASSNMTLVPDASPNIVTMAFVRSFQNSCICIASNSDPLSSNPLNAQILELEVLILRLMVARNLLEPVVLVKTLIECLGLLRSMKGDGSVVKKKTWKKRRLDDEEKSTSSVTLGDRDLFLPGLNQREPYIFVVRAIANAISAVVDASCCDFEDAQSMTVEWLVDDSDDDSITVTEQSKPLIEYAVSVSMDAAMDIDPVLRVISLAILSRYLCLCDSDIDEPSKCDSVVVEKAIQYKEWSLPTRHKDAPPPNFVLHNISTHLDALLMFIRFFEDSDHGVRKQALTSIIRLCRQLLTTTRLNTAEIWQWPPSVINVIDKVYFSASLSLNDEFEDVRLAAMYTVFYCCKMVGSLLIRPLIPRGKKRYNSKHNYSYVRMVDDCFVRLCNMMNDSIVCLRAAACELIGHLSGVSSACLLQSLSKKEVTADEIIQGSGEAGTSLSTEPDDDMVQAFLEGGSFGAFVHGFEDEFCQVRINAVKGLRNLCLQELKRSLEDRDKIQCTSKLLPPPPISVAKSISFLCDAFNDESVTVRVIALSAVSSILKQCLYRVKESQLELILGTFGDSDVAVRVAVLSLLCHCHLRSVMDLKRCIDALLSGVSRYPSDLTSSMVASHLLGRHHSHFAEFFVERVLDIDPQFITREVASVTSPSFLITFVFVFGGVEESPASILPLIPPWCHKVADYLRDTYPDIVPKILVWDVSKAITQYHVTERVGAEIGSFSETKRNSLVAVDMAYVKQAYGNVTIAFRKLNQYVRSSIDAIDSAEEDAACGGSISSMTNIIAEQSNLICRITDTAMYHIRQVMTAIDVRRHLIDQKHVTEPSRHFLQCSTAVVIAIKEFFISYCADRNPNSAIGMCSKKTVIDRLSARRVVQRLTRSTCELRTKFDGFNPDVRRDLYQFEGMVMLMIALSDGHEGKCYVLKWCGEVDDFCICHQLSTPFIVDTIRRIATTPCQGSATNTNKGQLGIASRSCLPVGSSSFADKLNSFITLDEIVFLLCRMLTSLSSSPHFHSVRQLRAVIVGPLTCGEKPIECSSLFGTRVVIEADVFNMDDDDTKSTLAVEVTWPDHNIHYFIPDRCDVVQLESSSKHRLTTTIYLRHRCWSQSGSVNVRILRVLGGNLGSYLSANMPASSTSVGNHAWWGWKKIPSSRRFAGAAVISSTYVLHVFPR